MLNRRYLLQDSRGHHSWSLTLAVPSLIAMTLRLVLGGVPIPGLGVTLPPWTAADYSLVAGVWLIFVGQREHEEKKTRGGTP